MHLCYFSAHHSSTESLYPPRCGVTIPVSTHAEPLLRRVRGRAGDGHFMKGDNSIRAWKAFGFFLLHIKSVIKMWDSRLNWSCDTWTICRLRPQQQISNSSRLHYKELIKTLRPTLERHSSCSWAKTKDRVFHGEYHRYDVMCHTRLWWPQG